MNVPNDANSVKFMVGSPTVEGSSTSRMRVSGQRRSNRLSSAEEVADGSPQQQMRSCASISDMVSRGVIETSTTTGFTPKRHVNLL